MKNLIENFKLIRKNLYEDVFSSLKLYGWNKKYSKVKALMCIEIGAILAFLAIKFKIKPNAITFSFIFLVFLATFFLSTGNDVLIIFGLIIFFLKNTLDLIDGYVARSTNQTSNLGHILDVWAGVISHMLFQIATCLYVYSKTLNSFFLYVSLIIAVLSFLDFKKHYLSLSKKESEEKIASDWKLKKQNIAEKFSGAIKYLVKLLLILDYDGRSRYTDLVILIVLIEVFKSQLILTHIIVLIWLSTSIAKFFYKLYSMLILEKNKNN